MMISFAKLGIEFTVLEFTFAMVFLAQPRIKKF